MAKSYDYQSAFDIIGPVMMGPSSSHTAGAVKIGIQHAILGDILKILKYIIMNHLLKHTRTWYRCRYCGWSNGIFNFDNRIKSSLEIAADDGIKIDIIEEEGDSIGQHPNCAYIKSSRNDGRYIEIIGISIGGGTIKIKGIHINGLEVDLNHGLPILVVDGNMTKAQVNHFINDINDMKLDCKDEFIKIDEDKCLVVIPLNKAISESTLNTIKEKYSDVNVSYIN